MGFPSPTLRWKNDGFIGRVCARYGRCYYRRVFVPLVACACFCCCAWHVTCTMVPWFCSLYIVRHCIDISTCGVLPILVLAGGTGGACPSTLFANSFSLSPLWFVFTGSTGSLFVSSADTRVGVAATNVSPITSLFSPVCSFDLVVPDSSILWLDGGRIPSVHVVPALSFVLTTGCTLHAVSTFLLSIPSFYLCDRIVYQRPVPPAVARLGLPVTYC